MDYLTSASKAYYQKDLEEKVMTLQDAYWKFDAELSDLVSRINQHPGLQTLYSRSYSPERSGLDLNPLSYLKIAYTPKMRLPLGKVLVEIYNTLSSQESPVEVNEEPPQDNLNYRPGKVGGMGCLDDPDYFRIWHFSISIRSEEKEVHKQFWSLLQGRFSGLLAPE
ncbi:MAG: hypothetical protein ACYC1Q_06335 [Bacteroidia bacterium]